MNVSRYVVSLALMVAFQGAIFAQSGLSISISVDGPRPVASAAQKLEKLSGRLVTYEDPQWAVPTETVDVTEFVRRDLDGTSEDTKTEVPRVIGPRGGKLSFSVEERDGPSSLNPRNVVQKILAANSAAGNSGGFRVLESNGRLHIVPAAQGDAVHRSPLDASITIPQEDRNGIQILEAICKQLSLTTGHVVTLGTIPLNPFFHHHAFYGASGQNAREFLSLVLDSIGPGYSWQLFFDPGDKMYGLNIHWVHSPE